MELRSSEGISNRELLSRERHLVKLKRGGGSLRVHLVYPNNYWVAMSNLGFQAVYSLFAGDAEISLERAFLPDGAETGKITKPWRTFESERLIADCDVLAFSLSFETDYLNLLAILKNQGLLDAENPERPLILAGGTAVTLNPEPIADFVDVILIGEAEEFLPEFISSVTTAKREGRPFADLVRELSLLEGAYVPKLYRPVYNPDHTIAGFEQSEPSTEEAASKPKRRFVKDISKFPTYTKVLTPETEFRDMFLAETGRGCEMGCRFCVAGYIYRPVRKQTEETLKDIVQIGLERSETIGFVGAAVSSHKAITRLASSVAQSGARATLSSLMAQKVTPELAASLSESEYKTVALAPEAGTERLRRAAGKRVSNDEIVGAALNLARTGIRGFKLYFIVGLPTETDADVDAIAELSIAVRGAVVGAGQELGQMPWVVLSVNPFIPKASTPFQWEPMLERKTLERKIKRVQELIKRTPNLEMKFESPRESYFQALLSRGDRRVGLLLRETLRRGKDWRWLVSQAAKEVVSGVPPIDFYVSRRISFDEVLPWDVVDSRIDKKLLMREALRAHNCEEECQ